MRLVAELRTLGLAGRPLVRIAVAAGLGGAIGLERELDEKAAGLRTHMLVSVGSALFTLVGAYGFDGLPASGSVDPTERIAAQIVTGIGFLGAGVIFRQGFTIRGLTTAASLWLVAAIGMAAGAGLLEGRRDRDGRRAGQPPAARVAEGARAPAARGRPACRSSSPRARRAGRRCSTRSSASGDLLALRRDGSRLEIELRIDRDAARAGAGRDRRARRRSRKRAGPKLILCSRNEHKLRRAAGGAPRVDDRAARRRRLSRRRRRDATRRTRAARRATAGLSRRPTPGSSARTPGSRSRRSAGRRASTRPAGLADRPRAARGRPRERDPAVGRATSASWSRSPPTAARSSPTARSTARSPTSARGDGGFGYDPIFVPDGEDADGRRARRRLEAGATRTAPARRGARGAQGRARHQLISAPKTITFAIT